MIEWHASDTGNHQGLVIETNTGRNVAVSYERQDANLLAAAPAMRAALESARNVPWVHNAAITSDIEALRAICLGYADWWNNQALPLLQEES